MKATPLVVPASLLLSIEDELTRACAKFPENENLTVALMEEVGELAAAQLQAQGAARVREEAVQVIVMALRIILEGDASL